MKRLAFGCFGVLSILAAVGAFWAYVHIVEPTRDYLAAMQRMAAIGDLDRGISKKGPFVPPASGELTPEMAARFARVQQSVREALGSRYDELARRAGALQKAVASGRTAPIAAVMDAYTDVVSAVEDGKRAQIEALNRAGFSLDEYEWVRRRMYEAAGLLVTSVDVESIRRALTSRGEGVTVEPVPAPGHAPAKNRELVQPYVERLKAWLPLAWFGL
jgi:hypothetical protein